MESHPYLDCAAIGPAVALPCLARQKESLYKDSSSHLVFGLAVEQISHQEVKRNGTREQARKMIMITE